jgi:hypothetical protein
MLESINKIRLTKAKEEYMNNGFTLLDSILSTEQLRKISAAIKDLSTSNNIELYKDRSGLVRRMENFTYKNRWMRQV